MPAPRNLTAGTLTQMPLLSRVAKLMVGMILVWQGRHRNRLHLDHLDPRLLKDIGLDQEAASAEAAKPFWRS